MIQNAGPDNPWRRLPWTVSVTMLVWTVVLWSFGRFMQQSDSRTLEPLFIDAQIVESSAPAFSHNSQPKSDIDKQRPKIAPLDRPKAQVMTQAQQTDSTDQPALHTHVTTLPALNSAVGTQTASPSGQTANASNRDAKNDLRALSQDRRSTTAAGIRANMGATAIERPMPKIPDDLREDAFKSAALALFHISADGIVKVELSKPTNNPRLNRILLASLKNWRFTPAIRAGKPVESTEEILIRIEVR